MIDVTRRQLFRTGAGLAAAAYLGFASDTENAVRLVGGPDWNALRKRVKGGVFLPQDDGYRPAARVFNDLFNERTPAAVALCADADEVKACLETAARNRIPIAARSGGHSYAGYSAQNDALMVNMTKANSVDVRADGTAVIGSGARLIDVYAELAKRGRSIPAGSCSSVGIAGLTLGGGLSVLNRKYGMTIDWVESIKVVTPDCRLRTASPTSEPELFWGLRGAGGGNFGIVTEFTFRTAPAPETVTVIWGDPGGFAIPVSAHAQVLAAWLRWAPVERDELWTFLRLNQNYCRLLGTYAGPKAEAQVLLERFYAEAGITAEQARLTFTEMSYGDAMLRYAGCALGDFPKCQADAKNTVGKHLGTSRMVEHTLDDATVAKVAELCHTDPNVWVQFDPLGGSVLPNPRYDAAFPHRGAIADLQIYAAAPNGRDAAAAAMAPVRDGLGELIGRGSYINYIDADQQDWLQASYGKNVARLKSVARRYDPHRILAFPQGITP
ncbi:FAD-binding oxidoreductase [Pseudonocardiaceae bacterium YIM PH 21723]|nr:FAD-binding oxidoreductase [Pseudonocardiaceae bacterium YIM PH 21723]